MLAGVLTPAHRAGTWSVSGRPHRAAPFSQWTFQWTGYVYGDTVCPGCDQGAGLAWQCLISILDEARGIPVPLPGAPAVPQAVC